MSVATLTGPMPSTGAAPQLPATHEVATASRRFADQSGDLARSQLAGVEDPPILDPPGPEAGAAAGDRDHRARHGAGREDRQAVPQRQRPGRRGARLTSLVIGDAADRLKTVVRSGTDRAGGETRAAPHRGTGV